jgi:hypothetical protein
MSWAYMSYWIEQHPGLASWVQAVGAIAAIGIAIWVPSRQRQKEFKAAQEEKNERELARTEQLLTLCKEHRYVVSILPGEYVGADYRLTNDMSKAIIDDQIDRLNYLQKTDESSERLALMLALRIELYDWAKFFSEGGDHSGEILWKRSNKAEPRLTNLETKIENLNRRRRGEPEVEILPPEPEPEPF